MSELDEICQANLVREGEQAYLEEATNRRGKEGRLSLCNEIYNLQTDNSDLKHRTFHREAAVEKLNATVENLYAIFSILKVEYLAVRNRSFCTYRRDVLHIVLEQDYA